jgi:hypothetical protein
VATNSSIGDCLLTLGRDGEKFICYEKALMDSKNLKCNNHSFVALAFVNLITKNYLLPLKFNCKKVSICTKAQTYDH